MRGALEPGSLLGAPLRRREPTPGQAADGSCVRYSWRWQRPGKLVTAVGRMQADRVQSARVQWQVDCAERSPRVLEWLATAPTEAPQRPSSSYDTPLLHEGHLQAVAAWHRAYTLSRAPEIRHRPKSVLRLPRRG